MPISDSNNAGRSRPIIRIIFGLLFVAAICAFPILINMFAYRPTSFAGWLIPIGIGVPSWLLVEWLGEVVFSSKVGYRISGRPFSIARVLYGVVIFLAFWGIAFLLWKVFGRWLQPFFS